MDAAHVDAEYSRDRRRLVEALRAAGIEDLAVLHAFDRVPRHRFVPEAVRSRAYADVALPLGHGQTISRPSTHALKLQAAVLAPEDRVLEIGTGSGYLTALLSLLVHEVRSIEIVDALAGSAARRLKALGVENVRLRVGDGRLGWPEGAPWDAILVGAAGVDVPAALRAQLADGGRLVIPVGEGGEQALLRIVRRGERFEEEVLDRARFVPLTGGDDG